MQITTTKTEQITVEIRDRFYKNGLFLGGSIVLHRTIHESEALKLNDLYSNIIIL